jgi:hypothetical protein
MSIHARARAVDTGIASRAYNETREANEAND